MKKSIFVYIIVFLLLLGSIIGVIILVPTQTASIVTTLLGGLLTFTLGRIILLIKNAKSQFSGFYRDEIFSRENQNEIIKRDKFVLREADGRVLSGNFKRYTPEESKLTEWECSGYIVSDQLLLSYRANSETTPSRGVIIVKQDTKREDGLRACYKGKYFKFEGDEIIGHDINLIKTDESEYKRL